ncbi:MAG: sugar phosphate nucleotidyltransferase [Verrucomicrobiota bacterium]
MPSNPHLYALVLAGGSGTRFWPLSRHTKPKQLLSLFDDETLIEKAVKRLDGLVPPERILVLTNKAQRAGILEVLPQLPEENVISEPARRDTAPAIALATGWIAARDPEATMIALPADQLVVKDEAFRSVLNTAAKAANSESAIVTLGIKPDWPCPSYGYIERGIQLETVEFDHPVSEVVCFREKPSPETAEEYLDSGNYSWNAGIFIWTIDTVRKELAQHCPSLANFINDLVASSNLIQTVSEQFPLLEKTSVDYALMEKAGRILNIEADVGWDDVGGWPSVAKYLTQDSSNNAHRGQLIAVDANDNIVFSENDELAISLLGVSNLIVVQTHDAVLVANREDADQIKALVNQLPDHLL